MKKSLILLLFLGTLFSIPIVTVGYSIHGPELAMLAALAVLISVLIGPLSFLFAISITTTLEQVVIVVLGTALLISWIKALLRPGDYLPYLPVTGWALMGAYFCILLFFEHAVS